MKRNKHNLSHYKIFSADMGKLYPISCFEALPGDTLQMSSSVFLRFAPMVTPVIHPIKVGIFTFLVPLRLLWDNGPNDNFEEFITGGPDGLDSSTPPTCSCSGGVSEGTIADYLGVPVGYTGKWSALPYRAYCKIFNEYFRDQDLVTEVSAGNAVSGGNTALTNSGGTILSTSWEKDYFTTARPWPQKGPTVTVPVNGLNSSNLNVSISGPITAMQNRDAYKDTSDNDIAASSQTSPIRIGGDLRLAPSPLNFVTPGENQYTRVRLLTDDLSGTVQIPANTSANIRLDDLREAFALQRFEEHRAMYGSRYTEYLRYLGVRSSDSRLQRPEYLGGGKTTMQVSEVLQTAADGDNPVGTLRGHGIGAVSSRTFRRFIEEHSIIMTLLKVQPIAIYEQGLNKMFSRSTKEDYWQKELEHIGQQEVLEKELYATGDTSSTVNDNSVFGYQNRYDEYRAIPSTVAGEMHSVLSDWHMARQFANAPVLNSSFISGTPTKRIFAEQTQNEVYCLAQHKVVARRFLSKQGNPIL